MRPALLTGVVALLLAAPAVGSGRQPVGRVARAGALRPSSKEGAWTANTGNGYFGGMQFAAKTWRRVGGKADPVVQHPGDPGYPFSRHGRGAALPRLARLEGDGGTWRSWGAVGAACSAA